MYVASKAHKKNSSLQYLGFINFLKYYKKILVGQKKV